MTTPTAEPVRHDGSSVWTDERGVVCIRASAMGGSCMRALVAGHQGLEKMAPPDQMQDRYDDGHLHEGGILNRMALQEKVAIRAAQDRTTMIVLPGKLEIHGHVDGLVYAQKPEIDTSDFFAVAEAKAFSDGMFKSYLAKGGPGELYGYGMQAKIYMLSLGVDKILYGVKNKNSGAVDVRWVDVDDPSLPSKADVIKRAMEIYKAVTSTEADPYSMECDKPMFPCSFFYLHEEIKKVEVEDQVLKDLLVQYKETQQQEVAAKAVKDKVGLEIAERMKMVGETSLTVLGWSVTSVVGSTSQVDWAAIELATGRKKADFSAKKPNSKSTVTVTPPSGWSLGQQELT